MPTMINSIKIKINKVTFEQLKTKLRNIFLKSFDLFIFEQCMSLFK